MNGICRTTGGVLVAMVGAAIMTGTATAQWSLDPAVNTPVAVGGGDQGVPLVRARDDGGVWISYMSNAAGTGYKPMVQRLNMMGELQLGAGVQLADRHNTAVFVYDMTVDAAGNAIIAFDDDSTGTGVITVQKVMDDGSLPWGATGKQMVGSTGALGPRVAACADGSVVVCWGLSNILNFQRLDGAGLPLASWTVAESGHYQAISDLKSGGNGGEVIAMWIRGETTSATTSRKGLKIQKFNGGGSSMWNGGGGAGTPIDLYTSSQSPLKSIQNGYFPVMLADGTGGAIVAWYDNGEARNAWLQHVVSAGTLRLPPEGLALSTHGLGEYRLSASVGYDPALDEYTVAWQKSNTQQSQFGIGAQRVRMQNGFGVRAWGESGAEVRPLSGFQSSFINTFAASNGSAFLTWIQYTGATTMEIHAARLTSTGTFAWAHLPIAQMCTRVSTKGRLGTVRSSANSSLIAAWADGSAGSADIYAQNIFFDGSLGELYCLADFNRDGFPDFFDYLDFLQTFAANDMRADVNLDGVLDFFDYLDLVAAFVDGC